MYIGHWILGYTEAKTWRMTPYKILELHKAYSFCHGAKPQKQMDAIDAALGGF